MKHMSFVMMNDLYRCACSSAIRLAPLEEEDDKPIRGGGEQLYTHYGDR